MGDDIVLTRRLYRALDSIDQGQEGRLRCLSHLAPLSFLSPQPPAQQYISGLLDDECKVKLQARTRIILHTIQ